MNNKEHLRLFNRADGVDGHYCVGRMKTVVIPGFEFAEYWNGRFFGSFGTVIIGRDEAKKLRRSLQVRFASQT